MKMKVIESGSSGNCSYLFTQNLLVLFDLGISYTKIYNHFLEYEDLDLEFYDGEILVAVTHRHNDHWKPKTFSMLQAKTDCSVKLWSPLSLTKSEHELYPIVAIPFSHGKVVTNLFVVEGKYAYLTDCDVENVWDVMYTEEMYNLDELLIESNYDERYNHNISTLSIANGYNVGKGFERHLSKQATELIVATCEPNHYETIHHSSRFYDWEEE